VLLQGAYQVRVACCGGHGRVSAQAVADQHSRLAHHLLRATLSLMRIATAAHGVHHDQCGS